jgi:hypothetical protein
VGNNYFGSRDRQRKETSSLGTRNKQPMAPGIKYKLAFRNIAGVRGKWSKIALKKLALLWEWGSYEELEENFPGIGLDSLGTQVQKMRHKYGISIPRRKISGTFAEKWTSEVTGRTFVSTPKKRPGGKKEHTILVDGKRIRRYRYEMEMLLGRKLIKNEEVHHLDANTQNDTLKNLVVVNKKDHFPFDNFRANTAENFIKKSGLWNKYIKSINKNI